MIHRGLFASQKGAVLGVVGCVVWQMRMRGVGRRRLSSLGSFPRRYSAALSPESSLADPETRMLPVETKTLHNPPLEELQKVFLTGLVGQYKEVDVEVVDCPDLRVHPFGLAAEGLGGNPTVVDVGGLPYLLPLVKRDKVYDMEEVKKILKINPCFILGACAGPWPRLKTNSDMMANIRIDGSDLINLSRVATVEQNNHIHIKSLPPSEKRFALLANLFCCEGKPSKVLKIRCKSRMTKDNFVATLRKILEGHYGNNYVGMGGVILIKSGQVKEHVMPEFSEVPLTTDEQFNEWLTFHDLPTPLVTVGTFVSSEIPGFDLRIQHFHSYGAENNVGGHYHYDTSPDIVEYEAYLNVASKLVRIDKPVETHSVGRD